MPTPQNNDSISISSPTIPASQWTFLIEKIPITVICPRCNGRGVVLDDPRANGGHAICQRCTGIGKIRVKKYLFRRPGQWKKLPENPLLFFRTISLETVHNNRKYVNAYRKKWRKNPEYRAKAAAYQRDYYERNKEALRAYRVAKTREYRGLLTKT